MTDDEPVGEIDEHYGAIGISAVAAALHYNKGECKNPRYARREQDSDREPEDS